MSDLFSLETSGLDLIIPMPTIAFKQLGIIVLDGSSSMDKLNRDGIPYRNAISQTVKGLFDLFKRSRYAESTYFSVISYDDKAEVVMDITKVKDIDCEKDFNPTIGMGELPYMYCGLEKAEEIADVFFDMNNPFEISSRVVIIILSNGVDMDFEETKRALSHLKENRRIAVACSFIDTFGARKDYSIKKQSYLEQLASYPDLFQSVTTSQGLKQFFNRE